MSNEVKYCSRCKTEKTLDQFSKNQSWCKSCHADYKKPYMKQYRKDNAEKISEKRKQYYEDGKSQYIYFIYANGSNYPVYVGSCVHKQRMDSHINLHSNISEHMSEGNWNKITYIDVDHLVNSYEERIFLEHSIINEICSIWNSMCYLPNISEERSEALSEAAMDILHSLDNLEVYKVNHDYYNSIDSYVDTYLEGLDDWLEFCRLSD